MNKEIFKQYQRALAKQREEILKGTKKALPVVIPASEKQDAKPLF